MKKIIAFIVLVILVIVMIVLSYNFYSGNNKNAAKDKLKTGLKVTKKKTSDVIDNVTKNNENNSNESNNNENNNSSDSNSTNNGEDITVAENKVVPDTASDNDSGYIKIDHYTFSVDKSTLKVGDTSRIHVNVFPRNASEREVSFVSSDNSILKVNSFGRMKALSSGEVTVTIKVKNCDDYNLKVNVK